MNPNDHVSCYTLTFNLDFLNYWYSHCMVICFFLFPFFFFLFGLLKLISYSTFATSIKHLYNIKCCQETLSSTGKITLYSQPRSRDTPTPPTDFFMSYTLMDEQTFRGMHHLLGPKLDKTNKMTYTQAALSDQCLLCVLKGKLRTNVSSCRQRRRISAQALGEHVILLVLSCIGSLNLTILHPEERISVGRVFVHFSGPKILS